MARGLLILLIFSCLDETFCQSVGGNTQLEYCLNLVKNSLNIEEEKSILRVEEDVMEFEETIKRTIESQRIESIFLLSIHLYEIGKKNRAREWAYRAGTRLELLRSTLNSTELRQPDSKEKLTMINLREIKGEVEKLLWGTEETLTQEKHEFLYKN